MKPRPADEPTDAEQLAHAYVAAAGGSVWAALLMAAGDGLAVQRDAAEQSRALQRLVSRGYVRCTLPVTDAGGATR